MLTKNPYLSRKAFRFYLFSTVIATMSSSLGIVVDAMIVGQTLGVESLTAISLSTPLLQFFFSITMLCNIGNALMGSVAIGKGRFSDFKAYFSYAMILNILLGISFSIIGFFFSENISSLLCSQKELIPLVNDYVRIVLLSAPLYLLLPALGFFVRADSAPKLTTTAILVANVMNLLLDIVLIKYFNLGISGSSLATSCGYFIGVLIFLIYIGRSKNKNLCFTFNFSNINKLKALYVGLPIALTSILMTVRIFGVNHLIDDFLSAEGLKAMAVCFNACCYYSWWCFSKYSTCVWFYDRSE